MPAGGFKTFTSGEILTAADVNSFLMQGVLVFADATARDAAITSPVEGQFAFRKDEDAFEVYDGSAWVPAGARFDLPAEVDSTTGSPTITTDGAATVFEFTGSGSITFSRGGLCDVLIVGAGGGGAAASGSGNGGGAGGGAQEVTGLIVSEGTETITIGAGGAGVFNGDGNPGSSSEFGDILSRAGGGGGGIRPGSFPPSGSRASAGASGGGGGALDARIQGGLSVYSDGFVGGDGTASGTASARAGGGGGGAGGNGVDSTSSNGGNGGAGKASSITGSAINYAGGGGGGSSTGGTGADGGGNGGGSTGQNGSANTGGGGGGALSTAGNGGSGVVIVRVGG